MPITKWQQPVRVSTGTRGTEFVSSAFDAIIFLMDSCEERSTVTFVEARNACRGALAGSVDAEVAREKFLAAISAAKMQVH